MTLTTTTDEITPGVETEAEVVSKFDREELCRLPAVERLAWVERVRVFHRRWYEITEEIKACHALKAEAAEPQGLLLVGPTGAGKTTLSRSYAQRYPIRYTPTGMVLPVLSATIPTPASEKNLATALLYALGDPLAGRNTTGVMTQRLIKLLRDCHVELVMLDELQHFVDRDNRKVLQNASNWLKMVIKEANVSCVLIGLEGEAEQVVSINPQLSRLFGDPLVLAPFSWDENQPQTIDEFRRLLADLEEVLPLAEPSGLASRETAWRLWVASGGVMSYLMALLRRATRLALSSERERVDWPLLAAAFEQRLAPKRRGLGNPFIDEISPPPPPRPRVVTPTPAATNGVTTSGTNRRSKQRKPKSVAQSSDSEMTTAPTEPGQA